MKTVALFVLTLFTIVACKSNTETENQSVTIPEIQVKESTEKPILEKGCYEYNSNGNAIKMKITELNAKVTADLDIAYAEKDSNQGQFVGDLHGDKLIGTHTFNAEGTVSSREMAFLIKDNQIIEGYGELIDEGTKFKDPSTIQYTSTMPLAKVDCDK